MAPGPRPSDLWWFKGTLNPPLGYRASGLKAPKIGDFGPILCPSGPIYQGALRAPLYLAGLRARLIMRVDYYVVHPNTTRVTQACPPNQGKGARRRPSSYGGPNITVFLMVFYK